MLPRLRFHYRAWMVSSAEHEDAGVLRVGHTVFASIAEREAAHKLNPGLLTTARCRLAARNTFEVPVLGAHARDVGRRFFALAGPSIIEFAV